MAVHFGLLNNIHPNQYISVRYEELLHDPRNAVKRVFDLIGEDMTPPLVEKISCIDSGNYGRWKDNFSSSELAAINQHIEPTLRYFGYE